MGYALGLPAALRAEGLTVELVPGWETRSAGTFNPAGAVCHWTAGPATGDRASLRVVTYGHTTLAGPLANVFLSRAGVAVVVAAGRANHAGEGSWRGLVGNSAVFGTEAENSGYDPWTAAQRWAYPRINAAYCKLGGFGPEMVCGHNEWAPTRKIDIRTYPMTTMRSEVVGILGGTEFAMDQAARDYLKAMEDRINGRIGTLDKNDAARSISVVTAVQAEGTSPAELKAAFDAWAGGMADLITEKVIAALPPDTMTPEQGTMTPEQLATAVKSGVVQALTEGTGGTL